MKSPVPITRGETASAGSPRLRRRRRARGLRTLHRPRRWRAPTQRGERGRGEGHGERAQRGGPDDRQAGRQAPGSAAATIIARGTRRKQRAAPMSQRIQRARPGVRASQRSPAGRARRRRTAKRARRKAPRRRARRWRTGRAPGAPRGRGRSRSEGLVDGELHRRRARTAAERERDGEARRADEEDDHRRARQRGAQDRAFDQAVDVGGLIPSEAASRKRSAGTSSQPCRMRRVASGRLKKTCASTTPCRP
jgi:hypothetical protein